MEMVPAELATQITGKLTIPTIGIGAGPNCDAQVLVWQDMAGLSSGKAARFVKRFAESGANYAAPQRNTQKKWPAGSSPPTSTASDPLARHTANSISPRAFRSSGSKLA